MKNGKSRCVALRYQVLAAAIGSCLALGAIAQTSDDIEPVGTIFGRAAPDTQIVLVHEETGERHEVVVRADGTYIARRIPIGSYRVSGIGGEDLATLEVRRGIRVSIGTGTPVNLIPVPKCGEEGMLCLDGGEPRIRLQSAADDPRTVFSEMQLAAIPQRRDITEVALLAPETIRGDSAFGNLASFAGSSVAENKYVFNGFNITNPLNGLGYAQVPFESIAEHQVMSGGWGAEYGGATGGIVNLFTKRGTNDFHSGASLYWSPESLRETDPDQLDGYGNRLVNHGKDNGWNYTANLWASGALVEDRLFAYALLSTSESQANAGASTEAMSEQPTWLLKLDWNINNEHVLEFTALSDKRETDSDYYVTSYDDDLLPSRGAYLGAYHQRLGGETYIVKYSAYLTDEFMLSALAGTTRSDRGNYATSASGLRDEYNGMVGSETGGCPVVVDARTFVDHTTAGCYMRPYIGRRDAQEQRDEFRVGAEWMKGDHRVSGGANWDRSSVLSGQSYAGGEYWHYYDQQPGEAIAIRSVYQSRGDGETRQLSAFVEDRWQLTDDFMLQLGLRWERHDYRTHLGSMLDSKGEWLPRLGFSWDVSGDSSLKVFGSAGRYSMPLPAGVIARLAGAELAEQHYYSFSEVDPVTGAPVDPIPYFGTFPIPVLAVASDPRTVTSQNLKPLLQDEYTLGVQKRIGDNVIVGARAMYRDLKRGVDDTCDYRPLFDWMLEHYPDEAFSSFDKIRFCHLINPGSATLLLQDVDGDGQLETIVFGAGEVWQPGNQIGAPVGIAKFPGKAKRTYRAFEVFFEGVWERFWLQGSYTWAKSRGNTEVGVRSETGQADVFLTRDFDYPDLATGADGYLPNDRRHTLKLSGNYSINDQWSMGGNLLLQSGRPISCIGYLGRVDWALGGREYFSCELDVDADYHGDNGSTIVPRGSAGRTRWMHSLDLNARYIPAFADGDLTFQVDVFNVFNRHTAIAVNEYGEDRDGNPQAGGNDDSGEPRPYLYGQATDWQAPRSVQFSVRYEF